jgi:pyruvate dehydrogenase complex dehydrogenase (E1) component
VYAAYDQATQHKGAPTVILAKTVKGWTLGGLRFGLLFTNPSDFIGT